MPMKSFGLHDLKTGEPVEGAQFPVLVGRKIVSPYGRDWVQVSQSALTEVAADREIGAEGLRVFLYLTARLDFENLILVPQTEVAEALSMQRTAVSRAMKLLVTKGIIVRAPEVKHVGRLSAYRLNEHYGWKGKVKHLNEKREARLRVIAKEAGPNVLEELENTP